MAKDSDIRTLEINFEYKTYKLRTPLKFGSVVVDKSTSLIVKVTVENRLGEEAEGLGSMPLAHEWAFPSPEVRSEKKLEAMKLVAESYGKLLTSESNNGKYLHPIDWFVKLEEEIPKITKKASQDLKLEEQLPILASLVAISPIDASLHDGFGKVNKICSYDGYSAKYVSNDLSFYLGSRFKGKYISDYIKPKYSSELPVFHLVGGLDKLWKDEVSSEEAKNTLPLSLEEWIEREGLFCFKIKLRGNDIEWDVNRTKEVTEVIVESLKKQGKKEFYLSVDSNEMHPSPEAVLEYLRRIKKEVPLAFERMLYIEQPVSRNLNKYMFNMKEVANVKPVLADEGVTDIKSFDLAINLGWSGIALKTCKTHSAALLLVAKAEEFKIPYSVQDLTCPGLALVHSAGFAARTNPIMGFEYNARQYLPFAFAEIQKKYPEVFKVKEGKVKTEILNDTVGLGLSL
ncbi:MAG: enolase C-terminal domain-like protein [Thermoproteota archaeon]